MSLIKQEQGYTMEKSKSIDSDFVEKIKTGRNY